MSSNVLQIDQEKQELEIPANLDELVAQERQQREAECLRELNALLDKFKCQMVQVFELGDQHIPCSKLVNLNSKILISSR